MGRCRWLPLFCVLLSACGWRLQGVHRVPEELLPLYLDLEDSHSAFADALQQRLRRSAVSVTADRRQARAILVVSRDDNGHHVSSVSALNEPQQYEVYYNVVYRLDRQGPAAGNLLAPQTMNAARTMSYDKTLALAKQREEKSLHDTLAGELADQVLRRLSMLPRGDAVSGSEP